MIGGIGTDLVLMPRIAEVLERHGERFARRVLTERELATWRARTDRVAFLAKRFAAKEAAAKALGPVSVRRFPFMILKSAMTPWGVPCWKPVRGSAPGCDGRDGVDA
ncbi:MAG: holo-ACP synthase [Ectothiorhodospiraceae bacterium]|nr:holo-ACP synthase [Ectothiorhodospiraceae bacterium]